MHYKTTIKYLFYTLATIMMIGCGGGSSEGSPASDPVNSSTIYTLTYSSGTGGSLIGPTDQTVNSGGDGVTVTATAEDGYRFLSWSDGSTEAVRQDRAVQSNIIARANFVKELGVTYQLRYVARENGSVFGNTRQSVSSGANGTTITAVADTGYQFVNWSDGVTTPTRYEEDVRTNKELTAYFTKDTSFPTTIERVTCDGNDDDIKINQALLNIANAGGGTVHLGTGTCVIGSPVEISGNNTILEGEGVSASIIKLKDEAGWYSMDENGTVTRSDKSFLVHNVGETKKNIIIRNFSIDGNKVNQHFVSATPTIIPDGMGYYNVIGLFPTTAQGHRAENILISNVNVYEVNSDAFIIHNAQNIRVEHCKTTNIGHSAIYALDPLYMMVENNDFTINANSGVRWYDGNHIVVRDNKLQGDEEKSGNSNFCIEVTSGQTDRLLDDVLIENNTMKWVAGAAIAVDAKDPAQATGMIIRNNSIYQCSSIGTFVSNRERGAINIKNFTNTIIENNTIVNCIGGGIRIGGDVGFNAAWAEVKGLTATIKNNIITHTVLDSDKGIIVDTYGIDIAEGNSASCTYNNVWNNHSGNYRGCIAGVGSISEDPHFAYVDIGTTFKNTHGRADFHLKSENGRWNSTTGDWDMDSLTSSSINAGDPQSDASLEFSPGNSRINMGVYGNKDKASKGTKSPPIANAGLDQYLREDGSGIVYVGLDASASLDDDTIGEYIWKISGLQVANEVRATIPLSVGIHTIELTVKDNDSLTTKDTMKVRVNPKGNNILPVAKAGEDQTLTDSSNVGSKRVILNGSASSDEDGIVLHYAWSENAEVFSTEATTAHNFSVGVHLIELTVTDNEGGEDTDSMIVTVKPKSDYALNFNNGEIIDEYVNVTNLQFTSDMTIEMWVNPLSNTNDTEALINMGEDGQRLVLVGMQPAWGVGIDARATDTIPVNQWTHLAFVVKNEKLDAIYINGVFSALQGDGNITMPRGYMAIAAMYVNTASEINFKGRMDEIRLWNIARTAEEIRTTKDRELTGTEAGLTAYFNFNEGSGSKVEDRTGTYDGTLSESMGAENWVEGVFHTGE